MDAMYKLNIKYEICNSISTMNILEADPRSCKHRDWFPSPKSSAEETTRKIQRGRFELDSVDDFVT